jgi:hypothetical protein
MLNNFLVWWFKNSNSGHIKSAVRTGTFILVYEKGLTSFSLKNIGNARFREFVWNNDVYRIPFFVTNAFTLVEPFPFIL